MLYFSESGWTLPNITGISQEFDQTNDQDEYEIKVGQIIRRIHDQRNANRGEDRWDEAVKRLRDEDHYLLVLIDNAFSKSPRTSRWETLRLILAGVVLVAVFLPVLSFVKSHVSNSAISKLMSVAALLVLAMLVTYLANRRHRKSA